MKTNATVLRKKKRFKIVFLPNFSTAGQTTVNKKAPIQYIIPINDPPPQKKKKNPRTPEKASTGSFEPGLRAPGPTLPPRSKERFSAALRRQTPSRHTTTTCPRGLGGRRGDF